MAKKHIARALKMPFADLLPPLSTAEFDALKADIEIHGVRDPVIIDEDGNILDGHHRYKIDRNARTVTIRGLSEPEKRAFVYRTNHARRNLSPSQRKELLRHMKLVAKELREQDARKYTQKVVAAMLGVARETVRNWFGTNGQKANTSPPDARVKVPASERAAIAKRVQAGEAVEQVAADYGVTPRQIRNIVAKEQKQQAEKAERQKTVAKLGEETLGIQHGDFRKAGKIIDDDSVDLIFTDPPYGKESVALYGDLSGFALRVLRPGGLCVAYAGQAFLPQVMASMATHLDYVWTFAKWHTEGDQRIRNFKIRNGWKPLLLFCKPPLTVWWDWLRDVSLGRKDKGTHEWQQAEGDAEYIIDHLCPKKGYVVDCFVGGGTTAVVSLRLKRRFIGFEIDAKTAKAARARLAKT